MGTLDLHSYEEIISLENLLGAWEEFVIGKRGREDTQAFAFGLMGNLIQLHRRLANGTYRHGPYCAFAISDPKPRQIHKATVADRVLHRAIHRQLYPAFDRTFISDSFSCRDEKGTHAAMDRFRMFAGQISRNHRRTAWVLKCDIRKFFASIDHDVLLRIVGGRIADTRTVALLETIVRSFHVQSGKGLPLGNLTSQLFANVYMDALDQYVKCRLSVRHYVRYADDFALLFHDRDYLVVALDCIRDFLSRELQLELHPDKVEIRTFASGVDFLGWVHFPDHRVLRHSTEARMFAAINGGAGELAIASYQGLLAHGNGQRLARRVSESIDSNPRSRYTPPA